MTHYIAIEPFMGPVSTNDDRAAVVAPFIEAFREVYYHHHLSEPMETVVADFIGDLMHYVDRLTIDEADTFSPAPEGTDPHDPQWAPNWEVIYDRAASYYAEEVAEEAAEDSLEG